MKIHLIQKNRRRFENGVVHSITCTMEEMERAVSLNLYLGINGWLEKFNFAIF
jgi:Tat protein secretion system quality control protein TatD with DNase activity